MHPFRPTDPIMRFNKLLPISPTAATDAIIGASSKYAGVQKAKHRRATARDRAYAVSPNNLVDAPSCQGISTGSSGVRPQGIAPTRGHPIIWRMHQ